MQLSPTTWSVVYKKVFPSLSFCSCSSSFVVFTHFYGKDLDKQTKEYVLNTVIALSNLIPHLRARLRTSCRRGLFCAKRHRRHESIQITNHNLSVNTLCKVVDLSKWYLSVTAYLLLTYPSDVCQRHFEHLMPL